MRDTQNEDPTIQEVWTDWISEYVDHTDPVPLFATDDSGAVHTKSYGKDDRPVLKRSSEMESLLATEGRKVVEDWQGSDDVYEGIIYLMYTLDERTLIPRYVGKAGKYGRDGESLSANLKNISTNRSKFARWGDGYAYHIGELSAIILNHKDDPAVNYDDEPKGKYQKWADELFTDGTRQLKEAVYFWAKAWRYDDTGPF